MFERYTESARRALFFSRYEASELGSLTIETEHLLLGVLRVEHSVAGSVLAAHGLRADPVRKNLVRLLNEQPSLAGDASMPGAQSSGPIANVDGIRQFLVHLRDTVPDKDTRKLIDQICRDLSTLRQRLS